MVLENILESNEKILWQGKPNHKRAMFKTYTYCFFLAIGIMLMSMYVGVNFFNPAHRLSVLIIVIFIALSCLLMIFAGKKESKNSHYIFTDKRIIVQNNLLGEKYKIIDYATVTDISVKVNFFDNRYGTGTIVLTSYARIIASLYHIDKPYEAFKTMQKIRKERLEIEN